MVLHTIGLANRFTMVQGTGHGGTILNAFDAALVSAKVGNYNLLRVSSILPPTCIEAPTQIDVPYGAPLLIAYGAHETADRGDMVSATIGVGIPVDPALPGVIMEHSHHGPLKNALSLVESMTVEAMELRGYAIKEVKTIGAQIECDSDPVCAFAGCVLWR